VRIPFRLVDVFTDRPLAGNQLCVIPDPVDIPTELMQALALEIGFSETTFVTHAEGDRYHMRIFTPGAELAFAGHPSIGTAFVLVSEGQITSPATQIVTAGEFAIEVDVEAGFARMRQATPVFGERIADRDALAAAISLSPDDLHPDLPAQLVSTGFGHVVLPLRDVDAVVRASANRAVLGPLVAAAGTDAIYLFALQDPDDSGSRAKARLFAFGIGIDEDPATGSAVGPLGAYLAEHGAIPPGRLTVSQGAEISRPSTLLVDVQPDGGGSWVVVVGGGIAKVGDGEFDLPAQ
jgi:trans-2,3-dihydro-3-hydroxyanthranilate isomerase